MLVLDLQTVLAIGWKIALELDLPIVLELGLQIGLGSMLDLPHKPDRRLELDSLLVRTLELRLELEHLQPLVRMPNQMLLPMPRLQP